MGGGRGGAHLHQGQHAEKRVVCITVRKVLGNCQNGFNMAGVGVVNLFLVMSCLLITLNKCLKGHKSLGLLLGGALKMSLSLSLSLPLSLFLSIFSCPEQLNR